MSYECSQEASRAIAKAADRDPDEREPLPLFSRKSLRAELTNNNGQFPFIRYDDQGRARLHFNAHAEFLALNIAAVYFLFWLLGGPSE